jgi:hypothetical protein
MKAKVTDIEKHILDINQQATSGGELRPGDRVYAFHNQEKLATVLEVSRTEVKIKFDGGSIVINYPMESLTRVEKEDSPDSKELVVEPTQVLSCEQQLESHITTVETLGGQTEQPDIFEPNKRLDLKPLKGTGDLTPDEVDHLAELEAVIDKGKQVFIEVGLALSKIRKSKLYRGEFKTFEAYCKAKWDISRPRAYELMAAPEIYKNLSAVADISHLPKSERYIRVLKKLEKPELQQQAWREFVDTVADSAQTVKSLEVVAAKYLAPTSTPTKKTKPPKNQATTDVKVETFIESEQINSASAGASHSQKPLEELSTTIEHQENIPLATEVEYQDNPLRYLDREQEWAKWVISLAREWFSLPYS